MASPFLTLALGGAEWSASCLGRFTAGEIARGTHWLKAGWAPEPAVQPIARRYS
jgi:hypothetical protein